MKRLLLSLSTLLCLASAYALEFTNEGITYTTNGTSTVSITKVDSKLTSATLSGSVTNEGVTYTVTEIGEEAFKWSNITTLVVPNTVVTLGQGAFTGMKSLTSITLPEQLTSIPNHTFYANSKLESIEIPDKVETIGNSAFGMCQTMTTITFPSKLKTIDNGAFYKSAITSADLSKGCENISKSAFLNCASLEKITFPANLQTIGDGAFNGCAKLTTLTLPEGLLSIGTEAFIGCPITAVTLPATVKALGAGVFAKTAITEFKVAPGNKHFVEEGGVLFDIDKKILYAYPPKGGATYSVSEGVLGIAGGAFWGSAITQVTLPATVRAIDDYAFCQSELATINFPESLVYIGEQAFAATKITSLEFPENAPMMNDGSFAGCSNLTTITIPAGVKLIDLRVFYQCNALKEIHCLGSIPAEFNDWYEEDEHPFAYVSNREKGVKLSVPKGYGATYKASTWGQIFNNIVEEEATPFAMESVTPTNGDNIAKLSDITIKYSEDALLATEKQNIVVREDNILSGELVTRTWTIDMSDNKSPKLIPNEPIEMMEEKDYYITIPAGTFKNRAGTKSEKIILVYFGTTASGIEGVQESDVKVMHRGHTITVTAKEAASVKLYNTGGMLIRSGKVSNGEVSFEGLAGGMYIVKVYDGAKEKTEKVII